MGNASKKLISAIKKGDLKALKQAEKAGGNIDYRDNDGSTPLIWAADNGRLDMVKYLVKKRCDINAQNYDGLTALISASYKGHLDIVKFLVEHKADLETTTADGRTPLIWAAYIGHLDMVEYFVMQQADVWARDNDGMTPRRFADKLGFAGISAFLDRKSQHERQSRGGGHSNHGSMSFHQPIAPPSNHASFSMQMQHQNPYNGSPDNSVHASRQSGHIADFYDSAPRAPLQPPPPAHAPPPDHLYAPNPYGDYESTSRPGSGRTSRQHSLQQRTLYRDDFSEFDV